MKTEEEKLILLFLRKNHRRKLKKRIDKDVGIIGLKSENRNLISPKNNALLKSHPIYQCEVLFFEVSGNVIKHQANIPWDQTFIIEECKPSN